MNDLDGLGEFRFQWKADGLDIVGATGSTFVLGQNQVGKAISVVANYTDGFGTRESTSSVNNLMVLPITTKGSILQVVGTNDSDVLDTTQYKVSTIFMGSKGDDTYIVYDTSTLISELRNEGVDSVLSSASFMLPTEVENLKLFGENVLTATGNALNNIIVGNSADNRIIGFEGNDTLTGGAGRDTFVFNKALNAKTNVDTITDFNVKEDVIELSASVFKKLSSSVELAGIWFKGTPAPQTASQYLVYDSGKGSLAYDADGSGKSAAVTIAIIGTDLSLTASNFAVG